jgi:hypothetical protein
MTCPVLGQLCASRHSHPPRARLSKAASSYRPIALHPEGLTVRDHCFTVDNRASAPSFFYSPSSLWDQLEAQTECPSGLSLSQTLLPSSMGLCRSP